MEPATLKLAAVTLLACTLLNSGVVAQRRRVSSQNGGVDFDCPDEFGYYPHPTDCTQYYVCVFGGALLESCTGGLMYSHELQTCDWPRNVGCGETGGASVSTVRVTDSRTGSGANSNANSQWRGASTPSVTPARQSQRTQQQQQQPQQQQYPLYADELGPAEEAEAIDRQQRVYRGQPPTVGQVARDRDGLRLQHSAVTNSIPLVNSGRTVADKSSGYVSQQYRPDPPQPTVQEYVPTSPPLRSSHTQQNYSQYSAYPSFPAYDDEVELYRDVDYSQYPTGGAQQQQQQQQPQQTYRGQSPYKAAPTAAAPATQYRGDSYDQQQYTQQPQDAYVQQDYSAYNTQQEQVDYATPQPRQPSRIASTQNTAAPSRSRGSASYTVADSSNNRGRARPTLKPSTAIVSKASEYIDIYRFPPNRPEPIYPTPRVDQGAAKCRKDVCLLPDCNCGGKDVPGDYEPEQVPQIVMLTFDDSVNDLNKKLYESLFERGRRNPNGCPISATFYVSHEWTDYSQVQNLYADGHEMASHSISHSFGEQFSQKKWLREIAGQREILAAYGGVKLEDVRGMRAPFLAVGGNKMFKMLYDANFTYDSSMPIYENRPPSYPYTLDYKLFHDCMIPPCPTKSYPGVWEVPMVMWQDLNGGRCSMGDACSNPPTADGVYKMLIKNFERHYTTNRAPFGLYYHAAWFTHAHHKEGFEAFLDTIVAMDDVWLVTNWQAIQWMRDPQPLSTVKNFAPFGCDYPDRPKRCNNPRVCNLWHKSGVRYMRTCQPCPDIYPWTGKTGVRNSRVDNNEVDES